MITLPKGKQHDVYFEICKRRKEINFILLSQALHETPRRDAIKLNQYDLPQQTSAEITKTILLKSAKKYEFFFVIYPDQPNFSFKKELSLKKSRLYKKSRLCIQRAILYLFANRLSLLSLPRATNAWKYTNKIKSV